MLFAKVFALQARRHFAPSRCQSLARVLVCGFGTPRPSIALSMSSSAGGAEDEDEDEDEVEVEDDGDDGDSKLRAAEGSLRLKVRQHVNPLASKYQVPISLDANWIDTSFEKPNQPLLIDVGCAKGTWGLSYARANPQHNVLGLEIRRPVVELALRRKQVWGLANVHFLATNANIDLKRIVRDVLQRKTEIRMVSIHHPDPHFKSKHKKRRVVNPDFVAEIASLLPSGVKVFVQSDVLELCQDMVETISANPEFLVEVGHSISTIDSNPAPTDIKTEREIATLNKGLPVFRCLFRRV